MYVFFYFIFSKWGLDGAGRHRVNNETLHTRRQQTWVWDGGGGGGERPALNAATPYLTFRDFQKLVRKIAQKVGCPLKMEIPGGVEFVAPGGGEKLFSSLLYTPPAPRTP